MTRETRVGEGADRASEDDAARQSELRALRRRAYGPDADIASDPDALARLRELESEARPTASHPALPAPPPLPPPLPPYPAPSVMLRGPGASAPVVGRGVPARPIGVTAAVSSPIPERTGWARHLVGAGRTNRTLAAGVAILVITVVAVLATLPGLFADRADAILGVDAQYADEDLNTEYRLFLRQRGVDMDDFVRFEDFSGLTVWGTPSDAAVRCVLVSDGPQDVRALSCVPRGLDPVANMVVYPGSPVPGDLMQGYPDAGDGTAVRFTLRGDRVEVRVVLAEPALDLS